MSERYVTTQKEFDQALIDQIDEIYIKSSPDLWIQIIRTGSAHVVARGSAHVEACGSAHVVARGSAHVEAWESAHVEAWGSAHVEARGSAHVVARGSAHVVARGSAHVEAWESAHVEAWGSAHVEACGSAHVEARESAHVVAWESAHVVAWGNTMIALNDKKVIASASNNVMVNLSNGAKCRGGIKHIIKPISSAKDWCDFYGVKSTRGIVILFKAVDQDFSTENARRVGIFYRDGETPVAPDWDNGQEECGGGLHFSAHPLIAKRYNASSATHFVACPIKMSEIVVHPNAEYPDKVKAPRVYKPCYEVDENGNPIKV